MTCKEPKEAARSFFSTVVDTNGMIELFRTLPNVHFFAKNASGEFMAANTPSLLRNGMSTEAEIIGKTDFDFHPKELAEAYRAEDRQVMSSRQPLLNQVWLVYDHLKIQQWFMSSKIPLLNSNDEAIGIAGAMHPLENSDNPSVYKPFAEAINFVLKHYDRKLRITELAEMSKLSVSQFDRRFRKVFGMSPTQYISRVRINAARNRLSLTDLSVAEIAYQCGFYDQAQLSRYFKRLTGMTPTSYRKKFGR